MSKPKAVLITALSGNPTILGALLGYVIGEILPQAILMYHSKLPAFAAIAGILVGLLIIFG